MSILDFLASNPVLPQAETPCQIKLDQSRPWHTTIAVRTGAMVVGIRADTVDTARWLESALEPIRSPVHDPDVVANFSVTLGSKTGENLLLVYHDHEIVARRRDRGELLGDLVELLDQGPRLITSGPAVVYASALWNAAGDVVLVPGNRHPSLLMRRGQLKEAGLHLGLSHTQLVDLATREVSLGCVDPALTQLQRQLGVGSAPQTPLVVRTWCLPAAGDAVFELRPPEAVMGVVGMVLNRNVIGMGSVLRGLADVTKYVRFPAIPEGSSGAQARLVISLFE